VIRRDITTAPPLERARTTSLLAVIDCRGISVKKVGRQYVTNCPLPDHDDRTPSFYIEPERNLWHCFGCNRGGDAIHLVELLDGAGFAAAVTAVARC